MPPRAAIRCCRPVAALHGALLLMIATTGTVAATPAATVLVTGDGDRYRVTQNRHGAVLRHADRVVYLGRDCDAHAPAGGDGRWGQANGGVRVTLATRTIAFPRQQLELPGARCPL